MGEIEITLQRVGRVLDVSRRLKEALNGPYNPEVIQKLREEIAECRRELEGLSKK